MSVVHIPGPQDMAVQALMVTAAAHGTTTLRGLPDTPAVDAHLAALTALDYRLRREEPGECTLQGTPEGPPAGRREPGADGTSALLLPVLADIAAGTRHAPDDLDTADAQAPAVLLRKLDYRGIQLGDITPPYGMVAHGLRGDSVSPPAHVDRRALAALLLTGPLTPRGLELRLEKPLTCERALRLMREWGARVACDPMGDGERLRVDPGGYTLSPDPSTAAALFAAAVITGGVVVPGLDCFSPEEGLAFPQILDVLGAQVRIGERETTVTGPAAGALFGGVLELRSYPALAPLVAVALGPWARIPLHLVLSNELVRPVAAALYTLRMPVRSGWG
ncbi:MULTISPECIES: hypothetical protein [Actinosynnema]|uniref:hypothetical protein n=1 Tax=Actinosynnema TaxID=40566 RepID=UPI0020A33F9D|nr:hypothetical protein [Actinosynnema pretiosum]MCP2097439.1 3-phosphoshikimate 1-carboxyvinyltransferase [Actinosynnema pretiosum]